MRHPLRPRHAKLRRRRRRHADQSHHSVSFVPKIEAGTGSTPPAYQRLHFTAGYTFQYWSNIAKPQTFANPDSQPTSRGSLMIQGVFLQPMELLIPVTLGSQFEFIEFRRFSYDFSARFIASSSEKFRCVSLLNPAQ